MKLFHYNMYQLIFLIFLLYESINTQYFNDQNFQLFYLQQELKQYCKQIRTEWLLNKNVRIMIEEAELTVQQSPKSQQLNMKNAIIALFKKSCNLNIYFTQDDLIAKVDESPFKSDNYQDPFKKKHKLKPHKNHGPINTGYTPTKKKAPAKIKGAGKTKRKILARRQRLLEEQQEERRRFIEHLKELARIKNDLIEKSKLAYPEEPEENTDEIL